MLSLIFVVDVHETNVLFLRRLGAQVCVNVMIMARETDNGIIRNGRERPAERASGKAPLRPA